MKETEISCIRGNISEIKAILNLSSNTRGADASKDDIESLENTANLAKKLAKDLSTVIVITGEIDIVTDGIVCVAIKMVTIFYHKLQEQDVCVAL